MTACDEACAGNDLASKNVQSAMKSTAVRCVTLGVMAGLAVACGGVDEGTSPTTSGITTAESVAAGPQRGPTEADLTGRLVGRQWVMAGRTSGDRVEALRPMIVFGADDDGNLTIGGYEGCNWWGSHAELTVGPDGPTIAVVGPLESTLMECFGEFGPSPGENVTYSLSFPSEATLVLRSPEFELRYVDLDAVDGARSILPEDLDDSWVFPGTDGAGIAATGSGPMFRYWGCDVPVEATPEGEILLAAEPNWSACPAPPDNAGVGDLSAVLIDASGGVRVPRRVTAVVVDDEMYVLGDVGQVYRLERAPSSSE